MKRSKEEKNRQFAYMYGQKPKSTNYLIQAGKARKLMRKWCRNALRR